jgi:hypothetical protein
MPILSKRAAALLDQFPGPVTIRCSSWLYVIMLGVCGAGIALLSWLVWYTWPLLVQKSGAGGLLVVLLLFGILLAGGLVSLFRGLPRIVLDEEGLAGEALLGSARHPWCDIDLFKARIIYVSLSDLTGPRGPWDKVSRVVSGGRRIIVAIYQLRPGELAPLLAAWRERALAKIDYGSSSVSQ